MTGASHNFSRYNTTTVDWDSIQNFIDALHVTFAGLAAANLHYGLFGELFEGLSPLPISDIPEDPVVGPLLPLGDSTLDHPPSPSLFPPLPSLGNSTYDW